jgi:copper chaperone CopZ
MMCQNSCGRTVQEALNTVAGVTKVIVSFKLKEAQIWGSVNGEIYIHMYICILKYIFICISIYIFLCIFVYVYIYTLM